MKHVLAIAAVSLLLTACDAEDRNLIDQAPEDPLIRAEGQRYFERLEAEATKTLQQLKRPFIAEKVFSGGDTSDARYFDTLLSGASSYRITGSRGTAPLMEFTVYDGKFGLHDESKMISSLTEEQISVEDGRFEIVLSPTQPAEAQNWMQTSPDARYLMIRQYSHNWDTTIGASFSLETLSQNATPDNFATISEQEFIYNLASHWKDTVDLMRWFPANNLIDVPTWLAQTMPAGHRFAAGEFLLEEDEVMVVEFHPPKAPYWGFQLTNYWFEPIDYGRSGSHLNNQTAKTDTDGLVRLYVSPTRVDHCNWIDTRGHRIGTMQFRLSRAYELELPSFDIEVKNSENLDLQYTCQ
ncbi:MAG: DUF1214 domain-containing protein [Deltaproteobacteria bacterium]|nr:DUF1214 domain-containing protein [Deltaproteobacteria bacterium]